MQRWEPELIFFFRVPVRSENDFNRRVHSSQPFLFILVAALAAASLWHLELTRSFYHGPRWMGLWDDPNTYGMLMGSGGTVAIGLLAANCSRRLARSPGEKRKMGIPRRVFLSGAIGLMSVGLVMSYSRGAWLGSIFGLFYLAWCHRKLKRWHMLSGPVVVAAIILCVWGKTRDSAPWYVKRADLGLPSAQHRVAAWRAAFEIMRDHPFGVGWNNAVAIYKQSYSPPEDGAAAITTNDYLMIGTEMGVPALICFVTYLAVCYRKSPRIPLAAGSTANSGSPLVGTQTRDANAPAHAPDAPKCENRIALIQQHQAIKAACLAGALVLMVAFWFDGGLFKLPTSAAMWSLLGLGTASVESIGFAVAKKPL